MIDIKHPPRSIFTYVNTFIRECLEANNSSGESIFHEGTLNFLTQFVSETFLPIDIPPDNQNSTNLDQVCREILESYAKSPVAELMEGIEVTVNPKYSHLGPYMAMASLLIADELIHQHISRTYPGIQQPTDEERLNRIANIFYEHLNQLGVTIYGRYAAKFQILYILKYIKRKIKPLLSQEEPSPPSKQEDQTTRGTHT